MKTISILLMCKILLLLACGRDDKNKQVQSTKLYGDETTTAVEMEPSLPTAAMLRVPVDVNGVEDTSKLELRLDRSDVAAEDQEAVVSAWNKGDVVDAVQVEDNLDSNSSSQSWFFRRNFGRGYGYGQRYYPGYNSYGRNFFYNRNPAFHRYGGYNYYYFPRGFSY